MKDNFYALPAAQQEAFQPVLYMIMGRDCNQWRPLVWTPFEPMDEVFGELTEGDPHAGPVDSCPFELYTREEALKYISLDVLRRGMMHRGDGDPEAYNYRLVPTYTGLEHHLLQRVMIFVKNAKGEVAPCRECPEEDIQYNDGLPLDCCFGVKSIADDPEYANGYSLAIYPAWYAEHLIRAQERLEKSGKWEYFTVPVSAPPVPVQDPEGNAHKVSIEHTAIPPRAKNTTAPDIKITGLESVKQAVADSNKRRKTVKNG